MRSNPHPSNRLALLITCSACLAASVASFCLAFTVPSPSQTLRPLIPNLDSMHSPVFVSMFGAALLLLASTVAVVSALFGNRAIDLACCAMMLTVCILSLVSLELASIFRVSAESVIESPMLATIGAYGPGNATAYIAWDDMQENMACCAVRTNKAQAAYMQTPWYKLMLALEPYSTPVIPNSCCSLQMSRDQTKLTACTTMPGLPAQNPYMNPIGCYEAAVQITDAFTGRYLLIGVILFIAACVALGTAIGHLIGHSRLRCLEKEPKRLIKCKLPKMRGCDNLGAVISRSLESVSKESAPDPAPAIGQARKSSVQSALSTQSSSRPSTGPIKSPGLSQSNSASSLSQGGSVLVVANQKRAPFPAANQRAPLPPINQRAPVPAANRRLSRSSTPPANQRAPATPASAAPVMKFQYQHQYQQQQQRPHQLHPSQHRQPSQSPHQQQNQLNAARNGNHAMTSRQSGGLVSQI